jgi:hypothetical protein
VYKIAEASKVVYRERKKAKTVGVEQFNEGCGREGTVSSPCHFGTLAAMMGQLKCWWFIVRKMSRTGAPK